MRVLLLLAITIIAPKAHASFPDQDSVENFYAQAGSVIYAQVVSGEMVVRKGQTCGAKYKIRVLRDFKGQEDSILVIGDGPGASKPVIGGKYLIFLSDREGHDLRKVVQLQGMPSEWLDACSTTETGKVQTLRIEEQLNSGKPSFVVPERIVAFPQSVPKSCGVPAVGSETVLELAWVTSEDAFSFLDTLRRP